MEGSLVFAADGGPGFSAAQPADALCFLFEVSRRGTLATIGLWSATFASIAYQLEPTSNTCFAAR